MTSGTNLAFPKRAETRLSYGRECTVLDNGKTILIVDDDEYFARLLAEELGDEGYTTRRASNGVEAILVLKHLKPSLIILDIVMPVMDGMEVLGPIVQRYEDVPVILHSSYEDFRKDFKSWTADAYLLKSPDFGELKGVIRSLLSGNRRRRPARTPQPGA